MAHITWLPLARLEEEWASDFGPQQLFFCPLVSLQMSADELARSIDRPPDTEVLEGLGEFHSWGGRVGMRLFQLLSPKTPVGQTPGQNAGLSVCPLAPTETVGWSILQELAELPQPMLSRVIRVHNRALDAAPQPGHFTVYYRDSQGAQIPLYFAQTAQEAGELRGFLRWHGVPMELVVAQIKEPPKGPPQSPLII
jgi:hypothetical protein